MRKRNRGLRGLPLLLDRVMLPGEQKHDTCISLDVRPGELVSVDAPEVVCDALQRVCRGDVAPIEGSVSFMGRDLATFRPKELDRLRTQYLGVVSALVLVDNSLDIFSNLLLVLQLRGLAGSAASEAIERAAEGTPVGGKLHRHVTDLTYAESRWVSLLRGLLMRPQLLLVENGAIDMPTELAEKAAGYIRHYIAGTETAVLWTTSSVRAACAADRMFLYSRGYLVDADDQSGTKPYTLGN